MRMGSGLFAFCLLVGAAGAQEDTVARYGGDMASERSTVRVFYWDSAQQTSPGQLAFHFSAPEWKKEYSDQAKFDEMTQGKIWRMGKDFWTVLDTNVPLTFGGQEVGVGAYYAGVQRSQDGASWNLVLVDPDAVRKDRLDAFQIGQAPIAMTIPLEVQQASEPVRKMNLQLLQEGEDKSALTFRLEWGTWQLTAPVQVNLGAGAS